MKILAMIILSFGLLSGMVDINNANKQEIMSLKGIGEKKADAIITYREAHCFKTIDDFTHVKGIGAKFLKKHKSELKVGTCKK